MVCKKDRFNTGNDLCSSKPQDLHDNAMIIDGYVNSDADYIEDRFGIERRTLARNNKIVDGLVDKVNTAVDDGEGQINKATSDAVASVNSAGDFSLDSINTATASGLNKLESLRESSLADVSTASESSLNQISTSKNDALIEIDLSKDAAINQIEEAGGVEILQTTGDSTTSAMSQNAVTNAVDAVSQMVVVQSILSKNDPYKTIFTKSLTNPLQVSISKGTSVYVNNTWVKFEADKSVGTIPNTGGVDYVVIVKSNGDVRVSADPFDTPATVNTDEIIIGGFHVGLVPANATLANGGFATSGAGMIWKQSDVDKIKGVNEYSFWDLRFRAGGIINSPGTARDGQLSNHGMVFDSTSNTYVALYHTSSNIDQNGVSKAGSDIGSGTVLPNIPRAFGGNGTTKYSNLNWWTANEIAKSHGARLLWESEFNSRAYGVTENKVAGGGAVTYPITERISGLTSRLGCEQAVGTMWHWGSDTTFRAGGGESYTIKNVTGGRGGPSTQGEYGLVKAIFGGDRAGLASRVGSRFVAWNNYPWVSNWFLGVVVARDLLII